MTRPARPAAGDPAAALQRAIGEELGLTAERTHGHLRHLRLHHPGIVQRIYGAQTSIYRLAPARRPKRTMSEVADYHSAWRHLEGYRPRRSPARLPAIAIADSPPGQDSGRG